MLNSNSSPVQELLQALSHAGKEPELSAVVLPALQDALAACLGSLVVALDACGRGDVSADNGGSLLKQEETLCRVLGRILSVPVARQLCAERQITCGDVLARTIVRHPGLHEVQSHAQWALAQFAGIFKTLEVVKPLFHYPIAVSAFIWTATASNEELDWESQKTLILSALQMVSDVSAQSGDVATQQRCYELIGVRLCASKLAGSDPQVAARRMLAAESVQVLAHGIIRWLGHPQGDLTALTAAESLWKVCRGSSMNEPACNPDAQRRLSELEESEKVLIRALHTIAPKGRDRERFKEYLVDLLIYCINGPPHLISLLSSCVPGTNGHCNLGSSTSGCAHNGVLRPPGSEELLWTILKAISRLQDIRACDAATAVHAVLAAVGQKPDSALTDQSTKALCVLMETIQSQLSCGVPGDELRAAMRCGAEGVLRLILQYKESSHGRWPSQSGRALRSAAFADPASREALAHSEPLQAALRQRIATACQRCDSDGYMEMENTFALTLTLWGVIHGLSILQGILETPDSLHKQARHYLIQAMCHVLAGTEEDLPAQDAIAIVNAVLRTKNVLQEIHELEPKTISPMAWVLGHALGFLGARSTSAGGSDGANEIGMGAETLVFFLDRVLGVDDVFVAQEVCWGVCAAAAAQGGAHVAALTQAGAVEKLEAVAEKLTQKAARTSYREAKNYAVALAAVLESLGRLRGLSFGPVVSVMQRCGNVQTIQVACLRALTNLLDSGASIRCPEEGEAIVTGCHSVLAAFGNQDERVRCSAERILGLLGANTR